MFRRTLAIVAVGIGLAGFARAAGEKTETNSTKNTITLTAVKTERGPAIRVSTGGTVLVVPRLAFQLDDGTLGDDITVENGKVWITGRGIGSSTGLTDRLGFDSISMPLHPKAMPSTDPKHKNSLNPR